MKRKYTEVIYSKIQNNLEFLVLKLMQKNREKSVIAKV